MQTQVLSVSAIENGTVVDHIPPGCGLKIVQLLKLSEHKKKVTVGLNLTSKSMGLKDIVKVEGRSLMQEEANRIALLAPKATINIIENFKVVKKLGVEIPKRIEKIFSCPNPKCITNHEEMETSFVISLKGTRCVLSCNYCEKSFAHDSY